MNLSGEKYYNKIWKGRGGCTFLPVHKRLECLEPEQFLNSWYYVDIFDFVTEFDSKMFSNQLFQKHEHEFFLNHLRIISNYQSLFLSWTWIKFEPYWSSIVLRPCIYKIFNFIHSFQNAKISFLKILDIPSFHLRKTMIVTFQK